MIVVWAVQAPAAAWGLGLRNSGLTEVADGRFVGWAAHDAYEVDGATARVRCDSPEQHAGLSQIVHCDPPIGAPFTASAWAKGVNVGDTGDFAVYVDFIHADGSPSWGHVARFEHGTSDWRQAAVEMVPTKPVAEIRFHLLLRATTGEAWFSRPQLQFTPVRFTRSEAIRGLWRPRSLTIRAETNMPASIALDGLADAAPTITAQAPSAVSMEIADAGDPESLQYVTLEARSAFDENHLTRLRLDVRHVHNPKSSPAWRAWTVDALARVFPCTLPPLESLRQTPAEPAMLDAVRNAHVDLQIAVAANPHPADDHADGHAADRADQRVEVIMGDLAGKAGTLPGTLWRRFRVGFVRNQHPAQHPCREHPGPVWWPDPLLIWQRLSVPPGQTRSAILSVRIPAEQAPGVYEGHVTVMQADGEVQRLPVRLKVHDLTLGHRPRIRTAFALMDGFLEKIYGTITPELRRAYTAFVLDHRLNPDDISRTRLPDLDELVWAKDRGLNAFNVLHLVPEPAQDVIWVWYAKLEAYTPEFKQRLIERLDAIVPELEKRGLLDMAYVYGFDERGPEFIPLIQEYFSLIRQRYPRLRTLSTCWPPPGTDPESLAIDWFCPLVHKYDPAAAERHRARGGEMWWYICNGPTWPHANWMLEHPLIESRLLWWQSWQHKVDGFLYWGINIWDRPDNHAPIPDDADAMLKWSVTHSRSVNGDGILLYPGTAGPLGSLRLLGIRAGIEDAMLLDAAEARLGRDRVEAGVRTVTRELTDFTRDPEVLHAARRQMLEALREAGRGP